MQIVLLPLNLLNTNLTKWSNTHKQFVGELPTNCLSVFDYFVGFALKGLNFPLFKHLLIPKINCHFQKFQTELACGSNLPILEGTADF